MIIDILCKEYGWTVDYIRYNLTLSQVVLLMHRIKVRLTGKDDNIVKEIDYNDLGIGKT